MRLRHPLIRRAVLPFVALAAQAACSGPGAPPSLQNPAGTVAPPPTCPEGARWDGGACVPTAACGAGTQWDGAKCSPVASAACPPGTHPGAQGCAPDVAADPGPPPKPQPKCPDGMALVGGGEFVLGARKERVQVGAFCMDKTETTADQYAACVKAGKCTDSFVKCAKEATYGVEGKGSHPMVCVDFAQAASYCAAQGRRLPTEAEWEWAARGAAGRTFPWGDEPPKDQLCWSGSGGPRLEACAVGSFPAGATPEGILDLAGNVFEWTTNKNDKVSPVRVARGGSWKDGVQDQVRAARPGGFKPDYRCTFLGIRCVTEAPPELAGAKTPGAGETAPPKQ